ncbi:MAG: GGDEF domain-containing protein [Deltaproteobacteria bacterium]|nr:GGDEF domain-containing protein [Deltaproteobacteria bacterium]
MAWSIRWIERHLLVEMCVLAFALALASGEIGTWRWPAIASLLVMSVLLIHRLNLVAGRLAGRRVEAPDPDREYRQLELLLVCTLYCLFQLSGGIASPLYPLLYALLAAIGGLDASARNAFVLTVTAICFEILAITSARNGLSWDAAAHILAICFFPYMSSVLMRALAAVLRKDAQARLARDREQSEKEAQEYRLSGGVLQSVATAIPEHQRIEHRQRSSLHQIELGIGNLLDILYEALRPHTIAVFMLSTDERSVRLKDARSESDRLCREQMPAGEGVIGAILKRQQTVSFDRIRAGYEGFTYYQGHEPLRTFMGVPILEESAAGSRHLRGILLTDRRVDLPFGEDDERLLQVAAREIVRLSRTEKLIADMDEVKTRTKLFYDAAKRLSRTVNLQEVIAEVLDSVMGIYERTDFAAIALVEDERLILEAAAGSERYTAWCEQHVQKVVPADSLAWLTVKRAEVLPAKPFFEMGRDQRHVFGRSMKLEGLESLKCFPLKKAGPEGHKSQPGERVIGALVVGGCDRTLFPEEPGKLQDRVDLLYTVAMMAATSIQNAQRYLLMARMATTDGLTGLHNHRRFQEMLEEQVAASKRYDRHLSLILTDIDHFKRVNDTWGHPVGDQVLKRVARVLAELARASDRVCRYGGEEFAIILPETDRTGAMNLAERFRESIKQQRFNADGQDFEVTLSLGICTLPESARHKQELIDRADQALYFAKEHGRDRAIHYGDCVQRAATGA